MTPLQGKIALVTGGAGGIGSAISRRLAAGGASVVVTYSRSRERAEALVESLPGSGHRAICAPVDDSAAQAALARAVEAAYGTLDILVNNAGITQPVPHADLDALTDDLIDAIFRVNVRGALASIRALKPLLMKDGGGLIVNISSIAGRTAVGSNIAYCASKAALDNLTMSLARALAPQVRVVSVSPGWVSGEYAQRMPPELVERQAALTPLGRIAEPEEVAEAVYVAAAHLTFTTGAIIPVDGGRPLG
jgi:3-oxoacyl-[acyl-carrier protein] reductase